MFLKALVAIFLAAAPCFGQSDQKVLSVNDFTGGLDTNLNPILLNQNESPNLLNVILDHDGTLTKRQGYTRLNAAGALGGGVSDVNAIYQLEQSNGNKFCVAFSSASGYWSNDGCQSFTRFVSTLTVNNDVQCDALQDRLYCVNNQYNFYFNGVDDINLVNAPSQLKFLRVYRNRCFAVGAGSPSRVYFSALGDCTNWNTFFDWFDVAPEDGDILTGIGEQFFDSLPLYKKYSTWTLKGATPASFQLVNISKNTGALNHRSIATFNNMQLFDSLGPNGGRPGIYVFNGIVVMEASKKLRNTIENLDTFHSGSGFHELDTKADWNTGIYDPMAMSADRETSFMESSFTTVNYNTWGAGAMVRLSSGEIMGSVTLSSTTGNLSMPTGVNADFETGTASNWTLAITHDSIGSSVGCGSGSNLAVRASAALQGNYNLSPVWDSSFGYFTSDGTCPSGGSQGPDPNYCCFGVGVANSFVQISLVDGNGSQVLAPATVNASSFTVSLAALTTNYVRVRFNFEQDLTNSDFTSGVATMNTGFVHTSSMTIWFRANGNNPQVDFIQNSGIGIYASSGSWTSPIFDTAISTPIGGIMNSTFTFSPTETEIDYFVRQSTSPNNDFWTSWAAASDTLHITMGRRYQQMLANLYTNISTKTPHLDWIGFNAGSTGTWTSPEMFLSNRMTSFGLFQTGQTTAGSAAVINYAMKISTYVGGTSFAPTIVVVPGTTISNSSGAYVVVIATFTIFSATEPCKTDWFTINWLEGAAAKSASGKVYNGRFHYAAQSQNGTMNDTMFILDSNGAWVKWQGVPARYLNVVNQTFVAGDAGTTSSGYVNKLYDTDSDNGSAISAYWESKDLDLGGVQNIKAIDRFYVVHAASSTLLTASMKSDGGLTSTDYILNLSTGARFGIKQQIVEPATTGNSFRFNFHNNAASAPWDVMGLLIYYRDLGLMP